MKSLSFSYRSSSIPCEWKAWCCSSLRHGPAYVQDTMHMGTKLKRVQCHLPYSLVFGRCQVTAAHVKYLIKTCGESTHGLSEYELSNADVMNFTSVLKVVNTRVSINTVC